MRILIIEDDTVLADGLSGLLKQSGYQVTCAHTGSYAEGFFLAQSFDLIILDLNLPDVDGSLLLKTIRKRNITTPVIVLTARDGINDKVNLLKLGADDYMVKPVDTKELESRIQALIRRSYSNFQSKISCGPLTLDIAGHKILADGRPMILFSREYGLLETLMLNSGYVVSKEKIAQRLVEGDEFMADNAIEVCIHRLRKRLSPYGIRIRTFRGLGYMLENYELNIGNHEAELMMKISD